MAHPYDASIEMEAHLGTNNSNSNNIDSRAWPFLVVTTPDNDSSSISSWEAGTVKATPSTLRGMAPGDVSQVPTAESANMAPQSTSAQAHSTMNNVLKRLENLRYHEQPLRSPLSTAPGSAGQDTSITAKPDFTVRRDQPQATVAIDSPRPGRQHNAASVGLAGMIRSGARAPLSQRPVNIPMATRTKAAALQAFTKHAQAVPAAVDFNNYQAEGVEVYNKPYNMNDNHNNQETEFGYYQAPWMSSEMAKAPQARRLDPVIVNKPVMGLGITNPSVDRSLHHSMGGSPNNTYGSMPISPVLNVAVPALRGNHLVSQDYCMRITSAPAQTTSAPAQATILPVRQPVGPPSTGETVANVTYVDHASGFPNYDQHQTAGPALQDTGSILSPSAEPRPRIYRPMHTTRQARTAEEARERERRNKTFMGPGGYAPIRHSSSNYPGASNNGAYHPAVHHYQQPPTRLASTGAIMNNKNNMLTVPMPPAAATPGAAVIPNAETVERVRLGFSPNYRGNIHLERNRSADIPDAENCALWVTNLPANVTTHQLLAPIRGMGRIFCTHINPPVPENGHHHSAAKVAFFDRRGAEALKALADGAAGGGGGFYVAGAETRVQWNRIKSAAVPDRGENTRVLLIAGPPEIVNEAALTRFFDTRFDFTIDEVITHEAGGVKKENEKLYDGEATMHLGEQEGDAAGGGDGYAARPGDAVVEYRFGSYRCQSQAGKMALSLEYPDVVRV